MSIQRQLKHLYARVRDVECKGLCYQACGAIPLPPAERDRLAVVLGHDPGTVMHDETLTCPLLKDNRCTIYEDRPLICRLYGAMPEPRMRCPHGCEPTMTNGEASELIAELLAIK